MQNHAVSDSDIVQALLNNPLLKFQDKGEYLRKGECPDCGKNELYLRKSQPYQVACSREGNCGYTESTRNLVPELFSQYTERFPKTENDPNATADAYLSHNRGFPIIKMRGWYEQSTERLEVAPGQYDYCEGIRFYIDAERTRYWSRLIDKTTKDGQKANFAGKRKADKTLFRGDAWAPPGMEINEGDKVYIVEGIFHAIAFWAAGFKAIAAFSCNNFPINFINQYKGKRILWAVALDDGEAGRRYTKVFAKKLHTEKEKYQVYLTGDAAVDWDDLFRAGRLTADQLLECLHIGRCFMAKSIKDLAYHWHKKTKNRYGVLDFQNRLYMVLVPHELEKELADGGTDLELDEGREVFKQVVRVDLISNCFPEFLYAERDEILDEQRYVFRISYGNENPKSIVGFEGSNIESPAAFNKALLQRTLGGVFDGGAKEMKYLRDGWLNRKMKLVHSNPFLGYDKDNRAYVFKNWCVCKGRLISLNNEGYFQVSHKKSIKTSFGGFNIIQGKEFSPEWFPAFMDVFSYHGLATLGWWTASFFAEQIREDHKSLTFFELTGEPGAGKSTLLEFMWKLSDRSDGYEGFDAMKATPAGRRRVFNQAGNLPVALIESDREDGKDSKKGGFNFDELKPMFNGRSTGTLGVAKRGHDTEEALFKGSVMISQNASVDGSQALLSRIVHVNVTKDHHTPQLRTKARWFEHRTAEDVGGYIQAVLLKEKTFLKLFFDEYEAAEQWMTEQGGIKEMRLIKNHAQVYASVVALTCLFPQIDVPLLTQTQEFIYGRAVNRQNRLVQDHPTVEQFWDTYYYLNEQPDKAQGSFDVPEVLNHSANNHEIAINLNDFTEQCRNHGQPTPDISALKKLLPACTSHQFLGCKKVGSKQKGKVLHCWVFKKKT